MSGFKIHRPRSGRTDVVTHSHTVTLHSQILTPNYDGPRYHYRLSVVGQVHQGRSDKGISRLQACRRRLRRAQARRPDPLRRCPQPPSVGLQWCALSCSPSWPSVVTIAAKILAQRNLLGAPSSLPCSAKWPLTRFSSSTPSTTSRASDIKCTAPRGR